MKFKKFIKDNIKRISSVILCIVLIFSLSITTYAFDGEAGGLDKEILNEYIEDATVFRNNTSFPFGEIPVYSPFNHKTLYYILKWPLTNDGWVVADDEYLAITTFVSGVNHYRTYYLIPEWNTELNGNYFFSALHEDFEFPDLYSLIWLENYGSSPASILKNYSILSDVGTSAYMNGYIYTVEHGGDNLIHSVSELYYGSYVECLKKMPYSSSSFSIVQIYYGSKSELSRPIPEGQTVEKVKAKNLNYLVSSSTYSVSAYDYFDTEAAGNSFISSDISFNYYNWSTYTLPVPECIRGSNFPSGYNELSFKSTDANYYLKEDGYFNSDRAFIYLPTKFSSNSRVNGTLIVFPEGVKSPIVYLKFCKGGGGGFFQLLSKVDYEVYGCDGTLHGTFDAETTTYTCIKNTSTSGTPIMYYNVTTSSNPSMVAGTEYKTYPCYYHSSNKTTIYLNCIYGNSVTLSMFPKNANTLGFYTYVSPNIVSEVLDKGNTGTVGGNIFDNIGGGGGFPSDTDWEKMWEFTIDYDSFESDAFKGYERSPYPDLPFTTLEGINLFTLPDDCATYMVQCVQWFGDELVSFTEYVGGPVAKVAAMMKMMFENAPDFLGTMFLLFFFFLVVMKIMQFDTALLVASGSADIYTGIKRDERLREQRLEKEKREREKQERQAKKQSKRKDGGS